MRARKRGFQRWHALLHQRIGTRYGLRGALGEHWPAFVEHAERHFKPQFIQAFCPGNGTLSCVGRIDGTPCPQRITLCVHDERDVERMDSLHLDHAVEVKAVCEAWLQSVMSLGKPVERWDEGIDGDMVCSMLLGMHINTSFRCGNPMRRAKRKRCPIPAPCHEQAVPHDVGLSRSSLTALVQGQSTVTPRETE